jgi:O-antigen ligase
VLLGVVALQLLPLPAGLAAMMRGKGAGGAAGWALLSIDPYETLVHLGVLATACAVFWMSAMAAQQNGNRTALFPALILLGSVQALYGLFQFLSGSNRIFLYENKYAAGRAFGTYVNPNHFAGLLEMTLPLALAAGALALGAKPAASDMRRDADEVQPARGAAPDWGRAMLLFFLAALMAAALVASQSRMGVISALTAVLAMILWTGMGRAMQAVRLLPAAAILAGALLLAAYVGFGPLIERFESVETGAVVRAEIWRDTLRLPSSFFVIGAGLGTFPVAYTVVQSTSLDLVVNHAHNDYLELAVELGIPVAGVVFAFLFLWTGRLLSLARVAPQSAARRMALGIAGSLLAILIHSMADFNLYIPANLLAFAAISGLGFGLLHHSGSEI